MVPSVDDETDIPASHRRSSWTRGRTNRSNIWTMVLMTVSLGRRRRRSTTVAAMRARETNPMATRIQTVTLAVSRRLDDFFLAATVSSF
jgi:hypothetical protein